MPTDSIGAADLYKSYTVSLKRCLILLLGDFSARVGKSAEVNNVIGMFREESCNASDNRLVPFLNEVDLYTCLQ